MSHCNDLGRVYGFPYACDPFTGTQVGDRLYGRGACDDAGGIAIHYGALKALGDDLGVNIKVFIEGEEEMGSPSFIPFIQEHRDEFAADVIIVADSGNWAPDVPTTSLRRPETLTDSLGLCALDWGSSGPVTSTCA